MSATYCRLRVHVVFRTIESRRLLRDGLSGSLARYLRGVVSAQHGQMLALGGGEEHLHLLLGLKPTQSVAEMMKAVKGSSSRWARSRETEFGWAPGYSVFSVSASRVPQVRRFILRQGMLHRSLGFAEEHRALLTRHGLAPDDRTDTKHDLKVHVVFATKLRMPWITSAFQDPLYDRIRQVVNDRDEILESIGGIEDHVHLLLRIRTQLAAQFSRRPC